MERILDKIEENRLFALAEERSGNSGGYMSHDAVCAEFGLDPKEIEDACESVDIE